MRAKIAIPIVSAVALALIGAAALPAIAAPSTNEQGSITINKVADGNNVTSYDLYQIFVAEVADGKATEVAWAGDATNQAKVKAAVERAIKAIQPAYAGTTAQEAATFLEQNAAGDSTAVDDPRIAHGTLLDKVADEIEKAGLTPSSLTPGTAKTDVPEGYVLVISKTLGERDATGTSPIFAVIEKDKPVVVTEKTTVPTIVKDVKENSTGQWGKVNDAQTNEDIEFRVYGTVAANVASYATYFYQFSDTMTHMRVSTAGANFAESDVTIKIGTAGGEGTVISADKFNAVYDASAAKLTVTFDDLKSAGVTITKDTVVTMEYKAKLNNDAAIGSAGNINKAEIEYANNPETTGHGKTPEVQTQTYAYELDLVKSDIATGNEKIVGAKFKVSKTENGAALKFTAANGSYIIDPDGTVEELETAAGGTLAIVGLDADTYYLEETYAPEPYVVLPAKIKAEVSSALKNTSGTVAYDSTDGTGGSFTVTLSGGKDGYINPTGSTVPSISAAAGKAIVDVRDDKVTVLPLTGAAGIALFGTIGGIIIVIAAVIAIKRARKSHEQD